MSPCKIALIGSRIENVILKKNQPGNTTAPLGAVPAGTVTLGALRRGIKPRRAWRHAAKASG